MIRKVRNSLIILLTLAMADAGAQNSQVVGSAATDFQQIPGASFAQHVLDVGDHRRAGLPAGSVHAGDIVVIVWG